MANVVQGIFNRPMFTGDKQTQQRQAAEGFSQIFAAILARQMRQSMVGQDKGPLGIAGGASGDIYGAFMDDAMGKLLAHSPAMKSLNLALERELAGPNHAGPPAGSAAQFRLIEGVDRAMFAAEIRDDTAVPMLHAPRQVSQPEPLAETSGDDRGPRLLPPPPKSLAPNLPNPFPLKG